MLPAFMKLALDALNAINLESIRPFVKESEWFYQPPGREHHKLLAYLSTLFTNRTIFDIGTHHGDSAHALAFNQTNRVYSFDITDRVPAHRRQCLNIDYQLTDLFNATTRAAWKDRLLASALIFIDIDPHEGSREFELVTWLYNNSYEGIIVLDDIWYFKEMRNNLWYRIEGKYKTDLTQVGHWSGTGLVSFHAQITTDFTPAATANWTLVTGYFDLTVMPDANPAIKARPSSLYLDEHAASVLSLDQNIVVFCEPKNQDKILAIRPKYLHERTRVVTMSFEDFPLTKHRDQIIKNRGGSSGCPSDPRNTASYYLFCVARFAMLKHVMRTNPFGSTHFAWCNICIERMGYKNLTHLHEALATNRDKFSTCYIDYVDKKTTQELSQNFHGPKCVGRCTMCSGFFTGNAKHMKAVADKVEQHFVKCLQAGFGHADEQLINLAYFDDPDLFDWYCGDYEDMVTNYAGVYSRPGHVLRNLIQSSMAAKDWKVCARACEIVWAAYNQKKCTLTTDEYILLGHATAACVAGGI